MHIMRTTLALIALASCAALAAPRTWTSADGRTIEAEYLGRGADGSSLVLERVDTKARVTIPLSALSAEDQTHAATLGTDAAPAPEASDIKPRAGTSLSENGKAMIRDIPAPWDIKGYASTEKMWEVKQLREKIIRELSAIPSGNPKENIARARVIIDRELQAIAETTSSRISENARRLWLKGSVLPLITKLEAEIGK